MKKKEIEIEIDENTLEIIIETISIEGSECTSILDEIEKAMGANSLEIKNKPEKFHGQKIKLKQTLK